MILFLVLALTAMLAATGASAWTLAADGPASEFLRAHLPHRVLAWLLRLGDWFGAGEDEAPVPDPEPAPRPLPPPPPASGPPPLAPENGQRPFGGAQSDLLHGIEAMVRRASSGDIRDVRRTIKTLAVASDALGHGVSHLSRRLAEPDKHYGSEIWEPLGQAAAQLRSSALHMGHSDAMMVSLLRSTVGELAESPRQAPHHSQLNGPV